MPILGTHGGVVRIRPWTNSGRHPFGNAPNLRLMAEIKLIRSVAPSNGLRKSFGHCLWQRDMIRSQL